MGSHALSCIQTQFRMPCSSSLCGRPGTSCIDSCYKAITEPKRLFKMDNKRPDWLKWVRHMTDFTGDARKTELHYIISQRRLHLKWPVVHQQIKYSSFKGEHKQVSFRFFKYQCLWVPGDWMEESSKPLVQRMRNFAHQTWVSVVGFRIKNC